VRLHLIFSAGSALTSSCMAAHYSVASISVPSVIYTCFQDIEV